MKSCRKCLIKCNKTKIKKLKKKYFFNIIKIINYKFECTNMKTLKINTNKLYNANNLNFIIINI